MKRSYLRYSQEALLLLGQQIKLERKKKKLSELDFAARIGIARSTLQRIERGDPSVEIGLAFNAAHLAGVKLFGVENDFSNMLSMTSDKLALLPQRIREKREKVYDDF